ncbi:MAG: hypothetical protein GEU98_07875 [Pseudonocardiaceae bacterium]|nr:hypothetical protein [Pseudonocardiaceae bacterium]
MGGVRRASIGLAISVSALLAGNGIATGSPETEPGPPLEQPEAELDKTLHCDDAIDSAGKTPVLFVPGTTAEGPENFSWNYMAVLRNEGHPVCWVDYPYPTRGWRDMQISSENVVHAIRVMYERSGKKVSTIGHSQGGLHPVWAARFWPDIKDKLDDAISLGSPFQGSVMATAYCEGLGAFQSGCQESFWQFTKGSNWTRALNAEHVPAGPSYSSLYTRFDEFAAPGKEASALAGSAHVAVQDVCRGRAVEHFSLVVDAAAYALVRDALKHEGPADPGRVDNSVCAEPFMPIALPELAGNLPKLLQMPVWAWLNSPPWTWRNEEPALRHYARATIG